MFLMLRVDALTLPSFLVLTRSFSLDSAILLISWSRQLLASSALMSQTSTSSLKSGCFSVLFFYMTFNDLFPCLNKLLAVNAQIRDRFRFLVDREYSYPFGLLSVSYTSLREANNSSRVKPFSAYFPPFKNTDIRYPVRVLSKSVSSLFIDK